MLTLVLVSFYFVAKGIGTPILRQASPSERILALQVFLAATALWCFPVAALLAERDSLMAALDLANARLRTDNESKSRMVIDLRRSLLNVEEQERLHLSHELHDQTGQPLAAALMELSVIEKEASADKEIAFIGCVIGWRTQCRRCIASRGNCDLRLSTN